MRASRALGFACIALIAVGCDEYPATGPGIASQDIVGQVESNETNILVEAWQAHLVKSTVADSAGYFVLNDMPVGMYELRFTTPSGKQLRLTRVPVSDGRATTLGLVRVSPLPWPIDEVSPRDGARAVSPVIPRIRLVITEEVDIQALQASTSFNPPVEGVWNFLGIYGELFGLMRSYYEFLPNGALDLATRYTLRIDPDLRLPGGPLWGDSLRSVFETDSLRLLSLSSESGYSSTPLQLEPRRDFRLIARFNAYVNADSLTRATSFTPSVQGVWVPYVGYHTPEIMQFFNTGSSGLRAEQVYVLQISGSVPLVGGSSSLGDRTIFLRTQPVLIVQSSPQHGQSEWCPGCGVQFLFNSEMDSASVDQAFSLKSLAGVPVPGVSSWGAQDRFYFDPDSVLSSGTVYQVTVTTAATTLWGDHLKEPLSLYFRVR